MRARSPIVLAALSVATMFACGGSAPPARPVSLADAAGSYRYQERVQTGEGGATVVLEGVFTVRGDTVLVEATPGPCRYDQTSTRGGPITYQCGDVTLRFDRSDPVRRSTYSVPITVITRQTVCVRYETNSAGQRVCAETSVEIKEARSTRSGRLMARRVE